MFSVHPFQIRKSRLTADFNNTTLCCISGMYVNIWTNKQTKKKKKAATFCIPTNMLCVRRRVLSVYYKTVSICMRSPKQRTAAA